ncbi:MAG: M20/M25/M40 family metallo-hydrolase [Bacteroidetes bacterium]|nr:M20/M25/M40 family metallo-hydrolase [Bacteroidota bacterium]
MELLKQLCAIRACSGDESEMAAFITDYVVNHSHRWKQKPVILAGEDFRDTVVLIFGNPRTAIYAHTDSIGFTVSYNNTLKKIGGPVTTPGIELVGSDLHGEIEAMLVVEEEGLLIADCQRIIERGTNLSFKPDFRETSTSVQCCYLDNRLGVYSALKVAESLENGAVVFSTYEEHGGGMAGYLAGYLFQNYGIKQALISDITWVTSGVKAGQGVAISMRDQFIPRRTFLNRILSLASESGIRYQLEVEGAGGSDGSEIQKSAFPIDWCFIGAPEKNVHSPHEWVNKKDIRSMIDLYAYLMKRL